MDFRDGGHVFSRGDKRRELSYQDEFDDGYGPDESQFAASPGGDGLSVRIARLTHYVGALVSVALMVGLMAWGWQLMMRDVSGVPVIKAVAGDARTTPDDPGGELTGHTGFAVNTVSGGAQEQAVQQVGIAPAATGLDDGDVAMGQLGATAREPASASEAPLDFGGEAVIAMQDSEAAAARAAAEAEALAEQQRQQALAEAALAEQQVAAAVSDAPAAEGAVTSVVTDETGAPAQAEAIREALTQAQQTAGAGKLAVSTRPVPRPRHTTVAAAPAAAPVQAAAATDAPARRPEAAMAASEAEAQRPVQAQVASGSQVVQIGAFDSNAIAESEWGRVSGKFGSLFSGKGQLIQQHQVNGRTFWRLRVAGFDSRADAQAFCAQLKAGGTDCIATAQ
ncbi:SPOR domain-containing protein [uncultured Paracoccus sp.]|nr:SPOR domain-containing protein [uncultured Paracoccus sp.]